MSAVQHFPLADGFQTQKTKNQRDRNKAETENQKQKS